MDVEELMNKKDPGVDVAKLKPGTRLVVKTQNSTYGFVTTAEPREVYAKGGKKIPKAKKVFLTGSTWGGSCLKIGWIGITMHMEIHLDSKRMLRTTAVKSIRVIGPNKEWFYDLS